MMALKPTAMFQVADGNSNQSNRMSGHAKAHAKAYAYGDSSLLQQAINQSTQLNQMSKPAEVLVDSKGVNSQWATSSTSGEPTTIFQKADQHSYQRNQMSDQAKVHVHGDPSLFQQATNQSTQLNQMSKSAEILVDSKGVNSQWATSSTSGKSTAMLQDADQGSYQSNQMSGHAKVYVYGDSSLFQQATNQSMQLNEMSEFAEVQVDSKGVNSQWGRPSTQVKNVQLDPRKLAAAAAEVRRMKLGRAKGKKPETIPAASAQPVAKESEAGELETLRKLCRAEQAKSAALEKKVAELEDEVKKQLLAQSELVNVQAEVTELQEELRKKESDQKLAIQSLIEQHRLELKQAEEKAVDSFVNSPTGEKWLLRINSSSFISGSETAVKFILKKYPNLDLSDYFLPPSEPSMLEGGLIANEVGDEMNQEENVVAADKKKTPATA